MIDPMCARTLSKLCAVDDVAPGQTLKVETGNLTVVVYNVDGEFYVTDDACTHGPGSLSEGFLEGDVIECNFHQGKFNVRSGEVVGPPCMVPIKTYRAVVEAGAVWIEVPREAPTAGLASSDSNPTTS